jgi:hypothetical protein
VWCDVVVSAVVCACVHGYTGGTQTTVAEDIAIVKADKGCALVD